MWSTRQNVLSFSVNRKQFTTRRVILFLTIRSHANEGSRRAGMQHKVGHLATRVVYTPLS